MIPNQHPANVHHPVFSTDFRNFIATAIHLLGGSVLKIAKCYSKLSYPIMIDLIYQEIVFYSKAKARLFLKAT